MSKFTPMEMLALGGLAAFIIYEISKGTTGNNSGNILGGNNLFSGNSLGFGGASGSWNDESTPGMIIAPDGTAYDELGMPI